MFKCSNVELTCSNGTMSSSRTDWKSPPEMFQRFYFFLWFECWRACNILIWMFMLIIIWSLMFVKLCLLKHIPYLGTIQIQIQTHFVPGAYSRTSTISCWFWKTSFRWTILFESEMEMNGTSSYKKIFTLCHGLGHHVRDHHYSHDYFNDLLNHVWNIYEYIWNII